jgi:hypothetical protein
MKQDKKLFGHDVHLVVPFGIAAVLFVVTAIIAWASFGSVEHLLVIHATDGRGDYFGTRGDVFSVLGIGAVVMLMNAGIANVLRSRERFLAWLVAYTTLFIGCLLFVAVTAIISFN